MQVNKDHMECPFSIYYVSRHVLIDCQGVEGLRVKLDVRQFVSEFVARGNSRAQAYAGYLNGLDTNGQVTTVGNHLARGWAILEIQTAWLSLWDPEVGTDVMNKN